MRNVSYGTTHRLSRSELLTYYRCSEYTCSTRFKSTVPLYNVYLISYVKLNITVKCPSTSWHCRECREWRHSSINPNLGNKLRWVVSFTPLPLYPTCDRSPVTLSIGGWEGPRVVLGATEKRKRCCPYLESNTRRSALCLIAVPTELSWLTLNGLLLQTTISIQKLLPYVYCIIYS
jgi:hypothetical protein